MPGARRASPSRREWDRRALLPVVPAATLPVAEPVATLPASVPARFPAHRLARAPPAPRLL